MVSQKTLPPFNLRVVGGLCFLHMLFQTKRLIFSTEYYMISMLFSVGL